VLGLGVGALTAPWLRGARAADEGAGTESHGMSAFGDLKYPADFSRVDYVNPDAPKGGTFSLIPSLRAYNQSFFTFNSFNAYILKGEGAQGMDLTFATLMARAGDEPDAMYAMAAKSVQISADKTSYRFTLRPEARFHDGTKLTAHDVAFSLTTLKQKGHPLVIVQLRDIERHIAATLRRKRDDDGRIV
jgi:microcin C transport system substrate-binding protein